MLYISVQHSIVLKKQPTALNQILVLLNLDLSKRVTHLGVEEPALYHLYTYFNITIFNLIWFAHGLSPYKTDLLPPADLCQVGPG